MAKFRNNGFYFVHLNPSPFQLSYYIMLRTGIASGKWENSKSCHRKPQNTSIISMDFSGKVVKKIKALSGNWKLKCQEYFRILYSEELNLASIWHFSYSLLSFIWSFKKMKKESCFNCTSFFYCGSIEWKLRNVTEENKIKEIMGKTAKLCRHYGKKNEIVRKGISYK